MSELFDRLRYAWNIIRFGIPSYSEPQKKTARFIGGPADGATMEVPEGIESVAFPQMERDGQFGQIRYRRSMRFEYAESEK